MSILKRARGVCAIPPPFRSQGCVLFPFVYSFNPRTLRVWTKSSLKICKKSWRKLLFFHRGLNWEKFMFYGSTCINSNLFFPFLKPFLRPDRTFCSQLQMKTTEIVQPKITENILPKITENMFYRKVYSFFIIPCSCRNV